MERLDNQQHLMTQTSIIHPLDRSPGQYILPTFHDYKRRTDQVCVPIDSNHYFGHSQYTAYTPTTRRSLCDDDSPKIRLPPISALTSIISPQYTPLNSLPTPQRLHYYSSPSQHRLSVSSVSSVSSTTSAMSVPVFVSDHYSQLDNCSQVPFVQETMVPVSAGSVISSYDSKKTCPICGKQCSRPSTLKTHILIHTGDKPFECQWPSCGRSFNVKSNMLRHFKSHKKKLLRQELKLQKKLTQTGVPNAKNAMRA